MSPDDIFAAQFWPWPDPAIKRDAQGRVLFVNAAFLGLYGGQVENWRGNAVGGWPVPQASGAAPYRFETRLPGADGSEQVYDWMEQTSADGNAFALARNVTAFTQVPQPDPAHAALPEQTYADPAAQIPASQIPDVHMPPATQMDAPPVQAPVYEAAPAQAEAQTFDAPAPAFEATVEAPAIPDVPMLQAEPEQFAVPEVVPAQNFEASAEETYALPPISEAAPAITETPALPVVEQTREFERRALPIESESSVLGNNWRDAVIAKAVGAEGAGSVAATETSAENAVAAAAQQGEGGPIRILLAEDNAINALLTRTLLEAEGHSVDTVEDGVLAVESMKTASYDLIFMDMRMPNMDGLEATRKIRALSNVSRALPIIALTANAFDDDRNACFDSGMNDFMTKPVSAEELSEKVRDWTSAEAKARMSQAA